MTSSDSVALLVESRVVERTHRVLDGQHASLVSGDEVGLLQPLQASALVQLLRPLVPSNADVIVAGDRLVDVLIGHRLADELRLPFASITNAEGVVLVVGDLPGREDACLVCVSLDDASTVDEFTAACQEFGLRASGCVAAVDGRAEPDHRVASLTRLADHVAAAAQCPICAGAVAQ